MSGRMLNTNLQFIYSLNIDNSSIYIYAMLEIE